MEEIWKTIEDYPNYAVSSEGQVKNVKTGKILKQRKDAYGYCRINLYQSDPEIIALRKLNHDSVADCGLQVHRLVAQAFCDGYFPEAVCDHINRKRDDNRAENLRWVSPRENSLNTTKRQWRINYEADPIIFTNIDGEEVIFKNIYEASQATGYSIKGISANVHGDRHGFSKGSFKIDKEKNI